MAPPVIAVFVDGQPQLITIAALRDLIGMADLEQQNADAANRLGSVTEAINSAAGRLRDDVVLTLDRIEPIEIDVSALQEAKVGTDAALQALVGISADTAAVQRQAQRDVGRLEEALLRAVMESGRTRDVLRDAGFVVDPVTAEVRFYALDQLADRTAQAEVTLDGQKALISSKASVSQVQDLIAAAVLDPSQVAELEPIIARLTSAESAIDGFNAQVALKADLIELTRLAGTVSTVSQTLDALAGTVATKASRTDVDQLGIRVGTAEQTLSALPNSSGFTIELRQARMAADANATGNLMALLGSEAANQRQITAVAEVRQDLTTRLVDGFSAAAQARTVLTAQIATTQANLVSQQTASTSADKALGERIDAVGITQGNQAAAIARLDQATIENGKGVAGATMTIRQQARASDAGDMALLAALVAGDRAGQRQAAQLVQIQTEFTTTLVANEAASAFARQTLLARMGVSEAAIVATSKALADTTQSLTERLTASEAAFNDATTGLPATRARLIAEEKARADGDSANAQRTDAIIAELHDPATGLPATRAQVAAQAQAIVDGDAASARATQQVSAALGVESKARGDGDKANADTIAQVSAAVTAEQQARVDADSANASDIRQVVARLNNVGGVTIEQKIQAVVDTTGKILGTYTLAIDTNGNLTGFQVVGSTAGPGSFNLINTDLRMGTGRVVFNNGSFMWVLGVGFGSDGKLISWYGPTLPSIAQCTINNAIEYKTNDGRSAWRGAIGDASAPLSVTSSQVGQNQLTSPPWQKATAVTRIKASFSWSNSGVRSSPVANPQPPEVTLVLYRKLGGNAEAEVARTSVGGYATSDDTSPSYFEQGVAADLTYADTDASSDTRVWRLAASLNNRNSGGSSSQPDTYDQAMSIIATPQ